MSSQKQSVNYNFTKYDEKNSTETNSGHDTIKKGHAEEDDNFGMYLKCEKCGLEADKDFIQFIPCHDKGANRAYDNKYRPTEQQ